MELWNTFWVAQKYGKLYFLVHQKKFWLYGVSNRFILEVAWMYILQIFNKLILNKICDNFPLYFHYI